MQVVPLQSLDMQGKRVLMRVDFNVPLNEKGEITDDTRIVQSLPSIQYILNQGAKLILMAHLGRPKNEKNSKFSLEPCAKKLAELLKKPVKMAPDCVGEMVHTLVMAMQPQDILMLENLRFHAGEEHPDQDPNFAKQLAGFADLYVSDAFGTAHRKHASTYSVPRLMKGHVAAGFLMEKEIQQLSTLTTNPKRPFYAILGGAKVGSKLGVLKALLSKVDGLFIGGGMAYTFLKAQGMSIGHSLCDEHLLDTAREVIDMCQEKAIKLFLPKDTLIRSNAEYDTVNVKDGIPDEWEGVDIGPQTIADWQEALQTASTVFWNGPMGIFEIDACSKGTKGIAQTLADLDATTVVGGGDSVAAIQQLKLTKNFTHISTGGGAALEFIEHGHLPGIDVLSM